MFSWNFLVRNITKEQRNFKDNIITHVNRSRKSNMQKVITISLSFSSYDAVKLQEVLERSNVDLSLNTLYVHFPEKNFTHILLLRHRWALTYFNIY